MSQNNLLLFSIMPLDVQHLDEYCQDILNQYETGVSTCALFTMTLVPEGNPPADKVGQMCKKYMLFKEKLDALGVPSGVLVQATIGHGWKLGQLPPFQLYQNFRNGNIPGGTVCPKDEGFRDYIYNVMRTIASCNPAHIMIDDDYRLVNRPGKGCACPLHMAEFNKRAGTNFTQEELWDLVNSQDEKAEEYWTLFKEIQHETLVETAKIMRAGIDSVNPKIPGSYCYGERRPEVFAQILAGKGNPVTLRIANGRYSNQGTKYYSHTFWRCAQSIAPLKDKVDVILAETDTCPQNRYSTGAMALHTHFTGSILEGCAGAKHWITKLDAFEPEGDLAYRKTLGKYAKFYQELAKLVPHLKWRGCRIQLFDDSFKSNDNPGHNPATMGIEDTSIGWCRCVLERMGIPLYFSAKTDGVLCMAGNTINQFYDEQILNALSHPIILSSDSAKILIERGFGKYLGVDVTEWTGKPLKREQLLVNGNGNSVQVHCKQLIPIDENVIVDSMVQNTVDRENYEDLFPGCTVYKNSLGGTVVVFAGTPIAQHTIQEAYSFLNYSRKLQLVRLLKNLGELPIYVVGDDEVYFKTADMQDGALFASIINTGYDPMEEIRLETQKSVNKIERLNENGERVSVDFTKDGDVYTLKTPAYTLNPVILIIK